MFAELLGLPLLVVFDNGGRFATASSRRTRFQIHSSFLQLFHICVSSRPSAVREVRSPQRHQNHGEWQESQVGTTVDKKKKKKKDDNFVLLRKPFIVCFLFFFIVARRKNWTSSWTVLQGSSLLFAKGQGGTASWVRIP